MTRQPDPQRSWEIQTEPTELNRRQRIGEENPMIPVESELTPEQQQDPVIQRSTNTWRAIRMQRRCQRLRILRVSKHQTCDHRLDCSSNSSDQQHNSIRINISSYLINATATRVSSGTHEIRPSPGVCLLHPMVGETMHRRRAREHGARAKRYAKNVQTQCTILPA